MKDCHQQQLSLCLPLLLGRRPATDWLNGLEYAVSYSLASALNETYLSLPALLKGMEVLTEPQSGFWLLLLLLLLLFFGGIKIGGRGGGSCAKRTKHFCLTMRCPFLVCVKLSSLLQGLPLVPLEPWEAGSLCRSPSLVAVDC